MEDRQLYQQLVQRYLENKATNEELDLFFHLLEQGKLDAYLNEVSLETKNELPVIQFSAEEKKLGRSYVFLRYAVAASLLLATITGMTLYLNNNSATEQSIAKTTIVPQATPGTKKAILTLSNGKAVTLNGAAQAISDGGANIITKNNTVMYEAPKEAAVAAYNTIATPKGGEYQVTLPDGTQVWLNAETSLRYPTSFTGTERRVELTGEAYFEVTKNSQRPFVVQSGDAAIKVLGTHFNVMAYADEPFLKATLAEGSVAISKNGAEKRLKPGQGGTIERGTDNIMIAPADVEQDLAWKNGNFYFNKTELQTIMKQIARWYDLDIRFAGSIPKKRFVGKISRQTKLSEVLDILRLSDVKFSMVGKTLIVEE